MAEQRSPKSKDAVSITATRATANTDDRLGVGKVSKTLASGFDCHRPC